MRISCRALGHQLSDVSCQRIDCFQSCRRVRNRRTVSVKGVPLLRHCDGPQLTKTAFTPTAFLGLGQRFRRSVPSGGFSRGVRRHTVSTAETTDCAHTYHHAFGLQQKGRSTGVVGCPEGRKCAPAIQSLRSLARRPSLPQYLPEVCRRRKAALARSLNLCPPAWATVYTRYQSDPHALAI